MNEQVFMMNPVEPIWIENQIWEGTVNVLWSSDGNLIFKSPGNGFSFRISPQQFNELYNWVNQFHVKQ